MRIITWNMNKAGAKGNKESRAWEFLLEVLAPDIALLQEVKKPGATSSSMGSINEGQFVWEVASSHQSFGTAIYSRELPLRPLKTSGFSGSPGRCVVAEIRLPDSEQIRFASLHAPTKPSVFPELNRCIKDLEHRFNSERIMFGGDLNTARNAESQWPGYGHGNFWNSVDRGRFFDCHYQLVGREKNTLVRNRGKKELRIQDDHIFVTNDLKRFVQSAEIFDENSFLELQLSDHLPLSVELQFQ